MIDLQKFIISQLKAIHPRSYSELAPQDAVFPLVIYKLPNSDEINRREDFMIEIDIWDRPADGSTVSLQTLADQIDDALNRLVFTDKTNGWNVRLYRTNRLMIPDTDPNFKRRQLRYTAKIYRRNT